MIRTKMQSPPLCLFLAVHSLLLGFAGCDAGDGSPDGGKGGDRTLQGTPDPSQDLYGDPLPEGAIARLGTLRLRGSADSVTFSPDGKVVASLGRRSVCVSEVATGKTLLDTKVGNHRTEAVRFSPDQDCLTVLADGTNRKQLFWKDGKVEKLPRKFSKEQPSSYAGAFSPDGRTIALGHFDGSVSSWQPETGQRRELFKMPGGVVAKIAFDNDGDRLAAANETHVCLWDEAFGKEKTLVSQEKADVFCLTFSRDGKSLAVGKYYAGTVDVYDAASGRLRSTLPNKEFGTRVVRFAPDGSLAHAGEGGKVHLWNIQRLKKVRTIDIGRYNLYGLDFSKDGKLLAVASSVYRDGETFLLDAVTGKQVVYFPRHERRVDAVAFSPNDRTIVTSAVDQTVRIWDAATGRQLLCIGENRPTDERRFAPSFDITPDGRLPAIADGEAIRFCDSTSGKETGRLPSLEARVVAVAFSPDGNAVASISVDRALAEPVSDAMWFRRTLHVRDRSSGKLLLTIPKLHQSAYQIAYSPDGKLLITRNGDELYDHQTITVWDARSGKKLRTFRGGCFAVSADSKSIAAFAHDWHVRMWNIATGRELRDFGRSGNFFYSLAFSPDGKLLAVGGAAISGGDEWLTRIYNVDTGAIVWKRAGHESGVHAVAFSANGKLLATAGQDTTALVWKLP